MRLSCLTLAALVASTMARFSHEWSELQSPPEQTASERFLANVSAMKDPSVAPCDNFYQHACGGWQKSFVVPKHRSSWTYSFQGIGHRVQAQLLQLLTPKGAASLPKELSSKILNFHSACTNTKLLDQRGSTPIIQLAAKHAALITDTASFITQLADLKRSHGLNLLMELVPEQDPLHPKVRVPMLSQGGISMPDRSFFLLPKNKPLINQLQGLMASTLQQHQLGSSLAPQLIAFEAKLASLMLSNTALRDTKKTLHVFTKAQVAQKWPLTASFIHQSSPLMRGPYTLQSQSPGFFTGLEAQLSAASPELLQAYLTWHLHKAVVYALSDSASQPFFNFFATTLYGQQQRMSLTKRCVYATSEAFPEIVGRAYTAVHFSADTKAEASTLIQSIETAFKASLERTTWLTGSTRAKALKKLSQLGNMVGGPSKWREYAQINPDPTKKFENNLLVHWGAEQHAWSQLHEPVERTEWGMGVYQVNAYYSPGRNQMVFPAAILQPPMFEASSPLAVNYGGIGAVMGHELTHGFDDSGSQFDGTGKLHNWWTAADKKAFTQRAQCVAEQYHAFRLPHVSGMPTAHVNGNLTLGEDLADNGGLAMAHQALQTALGSTGDSGSVGPLSADRAFFYSFAHTWCTKETSKAESMQAATDVHAPAEDRVNGAVRNSPQFRSAFGCAVGSKMAPAKQCIVWGA